MIPAALRRMLAPFLALRSLDAAGGGRRWRDAPTVRNGAREVAVSAAVVAARAQHFVLNDPNGARIASALESNLVGTGIVPRAQHPVETIRTRLNLEFLTWTDEADADAAGDFYALQAGLTRDMVVLGEGLAVFAQNRATGAPTLRRLHPEQLDRSKDILRLEGGGGIVNGVEFDAAGRRIAYWIRPSAPGEALAGLPLQAWRYPASDVVHMFRRLVPGQVRGLSWFAPVLLTGRELSDLLDAMLVRAKVAALFVGSVQDNDGQGGGWDPSILHDGNESAVDTTVEPGAIRVEQNGSRLEWNKPPDAGDTPAHASFTLRRIAAGMNVPYEVASGDYSNVSYSSARAALLEFRRFCQSIQHHVIVFQLCRPAWRTFVRWQVLTGSLSAAAFMRERAQFEAVKWLPPAWPWVDPEKDAKAAILEMDNLIRSRTEIVSERGYDVETLDREIAADQRRAERLGITPDQSQTGGASNADS